jgi:hypothetical protein
MAETLISYGLVSFIHNFSDKNITAKTDIIRHHHVRMRL